MEKGRGKGTDALQTDNVFTRKEYIEREAVLQAVCVGCDGEGICDAPALCRIRAWVSKIPAADVVPVRHGRWIEVEVKELAYYKMMIASMRCDQCGRYHNEVYHYGSPTEMTLYCPRCGARMDGDSNGV